MTQRNIAILIDGGFFLKRLPDLFEHIDGLQSGLKKPGTTQDNKNTIQGTAAGEER
ncbi:MAG: hypothetical protein L3J88_14390 [Gammaproteobacteria bacterium]|nr:hypothetical protein [Gammaproteobacteria bacterium]MCF6364501.1 hypothetical protein [Gammaproteobacteria bacterium]